MFEFACHEESRRKVTAANEKHYVMPSAILLQVTKYLHFELFDLPYNRPWIVSPTFLSIMRPMYIGFTWFLSRREDRDNVVVLFLMTFLFLVFVV